MTTTVEPQEFVGSQPAIAPRVSRSPRRSRALLAVTAVGASAAVAAGVRLIQHATDAIGRHGVGIDMRGLPDTPGSPWTTELIIAPHTYRFLGMIYGSAGWHTTYASIGSGLVTRPRP